MPQYMSHEDFIMFCRRHGVMVEKITATNVELGDPPDGHEKVNSGHIDYTLNDSAGWYPTLTVLECLQTGNRISVIKMTRQQTGMGLKEAKDLCDASWATWIKNYVDTIPFTEIPLLLNKPYDQRYLNALKNRLK